MQQLFPASNHSITAADAVASMPRNSPRWVYTNMIASVDGAAAVAGRSGELGGDADLQMFRALRAAADVIVVGAATVRTERYRLPRIPEGPLAELRGPGAEPAAGLCVVSGRLDLDEDLPFIHEALAQHPGSPRPIIATRVGNAPPAGSPLDAACEVIHVGTDSVDLVAVVEELQRRGLGRILCEGGPTLLGQLAEADLVDEWNFTVSPRLVGGEATRATRGTAELTNHLLLDQVVVAEDSTMFTRYVRRA